MLGIPVLITAGWNGIKVSPIEIGSTIPAVGVVRAQEGRSLGSVVIGMVASDIASISLGEGGELLMRMAIPMAKKHKISMSQAYAESALRLLGVNCGASHGRYDRIKEHSDNLLSEDL